MKNITKVTNPKICMLHLKMKNKKYIIKCFKLIFSYLGLNNIFFMKWMWDLKRCKRDVWWSVVPALRSKEMRREERRRRGRLGKILEKYGFCSFYIISADILQNIGRDIGSPEMSFISAAISRYLGDIFPAIPIPLSQGPYWTGIGRFFVPCF